MQKIGFSNFDVSSKIGMASDPSDWEENIEGNFVHDVPIWFDSF